MYHILSFYDDKQSLASEMLVNIIIPPEDKAPETGVDKTNVFIGKTVKFKDNNGLFIDGVITKINAKTATINANGQMWTVPYQNIVKD